MCILCIGSKIEKSINTNCVISRQIIRDQIHAYLKNLCAHAKSTYYRAMANMFKQITSTLGKDHISSLRYFDILFVTLKTTMPR